MTEASAFPPDSLLLFHFTRVEHLTTIVLHGLLADSSAARLLQIEIGNREIKRQRLQRVVPLAPGGVVADYVPFYWAPRSPMMYAIHRGNVPTYSGRCDRLVYLVTSLERVCRDGHSVVGTDRNAVLAVTRFESEPQRIAAQVDWPLMRASYWASTPDDPERRERRMAELLVHRRVPWTLFGQVITKSGSVAAEVRAVLGRIGDVGTLVDVRPDLYF